jgi:hypothetical protein
MNIFEILLVLFNLGLFIVLIMLLIKPKKCMKEGFNSSAIYSKVCDNTTCANGCTKPTEITDNCEMSTFKNNDGSCYKRCNYTCSSALEKKCKYRGCCEGCGKVNFPVHCIGFDKQQDKSLMYLSNNKTSMNNAKLSHPSANDDECSVFNQSKKNRLLTDENMNDLSLIYDTNHSYKLKYVNEYPCTPNITGTFTECGVPAINNALF